MAVISRQRLTLVTATAAASVVVLDVSIVNVAFPAIREDFAGASTATLSWVVTAYTLAFGVLLLPAGRAADRIGLSRAFRSGLFIFAAGSLICGLAPSLPVLIAGRVVQGVGGAVLGPVSMGLVLAVTPLPQRSREVARLGGLSALAFALGPVFGGLLIEFAHWRWAFLLNLPLIAVAWVLSGRGLVVGATRHAATGDPLGTGLLVGFLTMAALALSNGGQWGWGSWPTLAAAAAAFAFIPAVISRIRRRPDGVLPLDLLLAPATRMANLATMAYAAGFFAALLVDVVYLTGTRGWSAFEAGLTLTPAPVIVALLAPRTPGLASRMGHRRALAAGTVLIVVAMLTFAVAASGDQITGLWLLATGVWGLGIAITFPLLTAAALAGVPSHRSAIGSAVNQTFRQFGGVLGIAALAGILQSFHGTAGTEIAWFFCSAAAAATCLLGLRAVPGGASPRRYRA